MGRLATMGEEERTEKEDVLIGTNIEIESDWSTEQSTGVPPKYTLQPGGSAPVNVINYDNARISNLYLRLSTHNDHSKMPSRTSAWRYSRLAAQRSMHSTTADIESDWYTEQFTGIPPKYTILPGGSAPVNVINYDNAGISNLYLRLCTHKDNSKTPRRTSARRYSRLAAQRSMHSTTM